MEELNINRILEKYKPDENELSAVLFPNNNWPVSAFSRVVKGAASLDSEQIAILADYLGVFVKDLYTLEDTGWNGSTAHDEALTLKKGEYMARVFGRRVSIYKNDKHLKSFAVESKSGLIPFDSIIELLDSYINNQN